MKDKQIGGHLHDMTILLHLAMEMERDEEAEDIVSRVEEWLEMTP